MNWKITEGESSGTAGENNNTFDDIPLPSLDSHRDLDKTKIQLLAPVTSPDKVACVGMNYKDHCEEQGAPIPAEPLIFSKFPSCIIGPYDSIPYPDLSMVKHS